MATRPPSHVGASGSIRWQLRAAGEGACPGLQACPLHTPGRPLQLQRCIAVDLARCRAPADAGRIYILGTTTTTTTTTTTIGIDRKRVTQPQRAPIRGARSVHHTRRAANVFFYSLAFRGAVPVWHMPQDAVHVWRLSTSVQCPAASLCPLTTVESSLRRARRLYYRCTTAYIHKL